MDYKLVIAIAVLALLIATFFILFVINRKTPVPEGCENIKISEENCGACNNTECDIKQKFDIKKIEEELKKEQEEEK